MHQINLSLASFPLTRFVPALMLGMNGVSEPLLGNLVLDHVQLCPQNLGVLTEEAADELMAMSPETRFRLHANVRVLRPMVFCDASNFEQHPEWFGKAASISKRLNAPAYTIHAGDRKNCSMETMLDNVKRVQDLFQCPVGVEGLYPSKTGDAYLVSTWAEYRQVLESGVNFALDLSHLNIVGHKLGYFDHDLVREMLASPQCIEIHISDNDGNGDQHQTLSSKPFWFDYLDLANPNSVIFSEGNQLRKLN